MTEQPGDYDSAVLKRLGQFTNLARFGKGRDESQMTPEVQEMARNRQISKRANAAGGMRGGADINFATGRPRDPMFYWKQNNLPYDLYKSEELSKVRAYCRLIYQSHSMIGSCIDIYTKYPLLGMELTCKDSKLTEFYSDHFGIDGEGGGLDYGGDFLKDFGREYWTVGEAIPFATFNESLGVWDDEELLNPDDVELVKSPFLKEPRYFIRLPETIREILHKRQPAWEYEQLMAAYPELVHYMSEDAMMPVSSILLNFYRFKADTFNKRGVPLLMRALRPIMQEEMLNAAMDAIADRLYTPLILARLGASATDLGTSTPWIPGPDELADFEEALDAALAADFRVLIHHFGVQMESVFGREAMPDLTPDFERLEDRVLQTFGLSKTMLTGASSGQTYAADALNRDLVSQLLTDFQRTVKRHYYQRALVVAEAQEHYDYEERGGKRYVKMEEILEVGEDGTERIVEQPKLLVPDMTMKTMNLKDEEATRQFYEQLRAAGVPISIKTRLINIPIDFGEEMETSKDEAVQLAVMEQETRKEVYLALKGAGLPIPQDLRIDFEPKVQQALQVGMSSGQRVPMMGIDPLVGTPTLAPTQGDFAVPTDGGTVTPGVPATPVQPVDDGSGDEGARPEESDEMREDMPKAASQNPVRLYRAASRMKEITAEHYQGPSPLVSAGADFAGLEPEERAQQDKDRVLTRTASVKVAGIDGEDAKALTLVEIDKGEPRGLGAGPRHIGMRRHAGLTEHHEHGTLAFDQESYDAAHQEGTD